MTLPTNHSQWKHDRCEHKINQVLKKSFQWAPGHDISKEGEEEIYQTHPLYMENNNRYDNWIKQICFTRLMYVIYFHRPNVTS